ncbi:MAG: biotin transporter BioY [Chlamydiota bacterium]
MMRSLTLKNQSLLYKNTLCKELTWMALGSLFLIFCTHIKFYLPITPVPISMQNLGVFLLAAALGPQRAVGALALFFGEGFLGVPVFTAGGGMLNFIGPTGGYLMGYLLAAYFVGVSLEDKKSWHYIKYSLILLIGFMLVLVSGTAWLSLFVGYKKAIIVGMKPFLVVDAVKAFVIAALLPVYRNIVEKFV